MPAESDAEWLEKALRSQEIGRRIADLLNELARIDPENVSVEVYARGFRICGLGGGFHIDSLLSANDLRAAKRT